MILDKQRWFTADESLDGFERSVNSLVDAVPLCVVGTRCENNDPHTNAAFYCYLRDPFRLVLIFETDSMHARNVDARSQMSLTVADTTQRWGGELRGITFHGRGAAPTAEELAVVAAAYAERFPDSSSFVQSLAEQPSSQASGSWFCVFTPTEIRAFDMQVFTDDNIHIAVCSTEIS